MIIIFEARFIEQVGSNVKIKTEAGREFTLPITRFSQADQEYVKDRVGTWNQWGTLGWLSERWGFDAVSGNVKFLIHMK